MSLQSEAQEGLQLLANKVRKILPHLMELSAYPVMDMDHFTENLRWEIEGRHMIVEAMVLLSHVILTLCSFYKPTRT